MLCKGNRFPEKTTIRGRTFRNLLAIAVHLRHFAAVRGSPLLRSIFIVLLLIASATVLARLTSTRTPAQAPLPTIPAESKPSSQRLPYRLTLSAEPAEVKLSAGDQAPVSEVSGVLEAAPNAPLFLSVRWKTPAAAGEHRFAKLVLEPVGRPTITHVFDAEGDIDDVFELP
jgi:hypothetical protein